MSQYVFDNAAAQTGQRFESLEALYDPRYLEALAASGRPNVEVRRHDVGLDPLPEAAFDLVHARLVLIHVPQREAALARLVAALKPGGWILIEDFDPGFIDRGFPATDPEGYAAYAAVRAAVGQVMERHGVDPVWGRSLYRRFVAHGLEGHFAVRPGGSPGALLERANFEQVRAVAVAAGLVTDAQVDRAVAALDDPGFAFNSPVMMTAWGRKL